MDRASDAEADEYRAFFENAPIGEVITSPDGSWLRVNRSLTRMLGYPVGEPLATSFIALSHPEDRQQTREALRSLLAGERETCELETRYRTKIGSYIWSRVTKRVVRDAAGKPLHLFAYVVDITDRKRADDALQASEKQYRRLFESAKDGILILSGDDGGIVDVNPYMTELTGYSREHFLGKRLWEIGLFGDTDASKASFAELQSQQYVRYDDLPIQTCDGRQADVEFVSNVYSVDEKRVIQCNIRDITARTRVEAELRMLDRAIQAVSQGILITDACAKDNPIVYASPGFERLSGYRVAEVIGRNCRFMQGAGTDARSVTRLRESIQKGQGCSVELLNYRKDGKPFWNRLSVAPVTDREGKVTNFVGVQTDVTERRQLESQFLQAQKMEAVGRLAGGVAHDFNNLLSVILSYAEMIGEDLDPDEPLRGDIEEIGKAAVRATELTKQLLAFSRQQVLERKVLDLNQIVASMEKMLRRLLGVGVELTILPSRAPWSFEADPVHVEQVVMNLAVNARDAMPERGELTIETENVVLDEDYAASHHGVRPGPHVMLAVSDTGVGMDEKTQARIFEPFYTTKEPGKGTGLGLSTVFGIVSQSGGHIWVYSEPGRGTTFKVYFPRVSGVADVRVAEAPIVERGRVTETILLVEDDEQVRAIAQNILRRRGYVVLPASNGGEGLLICEKYGATIHLLVTDVVLPRMTGRELAERLAPMRPDMKVLFMSGYTDNAVLQHGVLDSGVAFLQKPLTPTSLTRKVREVLDGALRGSTPSHPS